MGYSFIPHLNKGFLSRLSIHVQALNPFIFTHKGVINIFIYELISYQ
jgi:hypothetical protein